MRLMKKLATLATVLRSPALLSELLQAVQIRLSNRFIRFNRKEQGYIDIDPPHQSTGQWPERRPEWPAP